MPRRLLERPPHVTYFDIERSQYARCTACGRVWQYHRYYGARWAPCEHPMALQAHSKAMEYQDWLLQESIRKAQNAPSAPSSE
jgi:hypothetical protein